MTRAQALELMRLVRAAYISTRFDDDVVEVWVSEFRRVDFAIGEPAVRRMIESRRRPTLADFHEQCTLLQDRLRRERRDRERHESGEALATMQLPPLRSIPCVTELARRWSDPLALPEASEGTCEDGCERDGPRVRFGQLALCSACARRRLRAGEKTNGERAA